MVNTDLLLTSLNLQPVFLASSPREPSHSEVEKTLELLIVQLGRHLTQRLIDSGHASFAELLLCQHADLPSSEECRLYRLQFDCPLINNVCALSALTTVHSQCWNLEGQLLDLVARRARREMNTINEDPPLATRLAREIESLFATSPTRGFHSHTLLELQNKNLQRIEQSCQSLFKREHMSWDQVMRADETQPVSETIGWAHHLLQAVMSMESIMQRIGDAFDNNPSEDGATGLSLNYRRFVQQKFSSSERTTLYSADTSPPLPALDWQHECAQQIAQRDFYEFALGLERAMKNLSQRLDVWSKNEIYRNSKSKPRRMDLENFLYVDSIRRLLQRLGEPLDDSIACAEKILQYCQDVGVAAAELIDDEIWSLYPRTNRESLKQARLMVRHSDEHFPLSVAHREWITRLTERALAEQDSKRAEPVQENPHRPTREQHQRSERQS